LRKDKKIFTPAISQAHSYGQRANFLVNFSGCFSKQLFDCSFVWIYRAETAVGKTFMPKSRLPERPAESKPAQSNERKS